MGLHRAAMNDDMNTMRSFVFGRARSVSDGSNHTPVANAPGSPVARKFRPVVEQLEARVVLHGISTYPGIILPQAADTIPTTDPTASADAAPLTIPVLNSLPGAPATLYLDFDGDTVASWLGYRNIKIPAFSIDTDPAFSQTEVDHISDIWRVVAQSYAVFNINVTTVDPRTVTDYVGRVSQIDVGGKGGWAGGTYGGLGEVGGMTASTPTNPVRGFVFPGNLGNGDAWYTAQAASHEAGHTMGLEHQSKWSSGRKTAEYQDGPGDDTAPIMGVSYDAERGLWWYGKNTLGKMQNDMTIIADSAFGLRADETGGTVDDATPLTVSGNSLTATGLITAMTDVDMWSFSTDAGTVNLEVKTPIDGMLRPKMQLLDASGNVVVDWVSTGETTLSWSGPLEAGSYRLVVASSGMSALATAANYGFNVGQYSITGNVFTSANYVPPPSSLQAAVNANVTIDLKWNDNADTETGFSIDRSTDGTNWTPLINLPADTTAYSDSGLTGGVRYYYRIRTMEDLFYSDYSNQANAVARLDPPVAPTGLVATRISTSKVRLTWNDNASNEAGYYIERASINRYGVLGKYARLYTVSPNTTLLIDLAAYNTRIYRYRIRAFNAAGVSAYSNTTPRVPRAVPAPAADLSSAATEWNDRHAAHFLF